TDRLKFDGFSDKPIGEYYKDLLRMMGLRVSDEPTKIWLADEEMGYADEFFKKEDIKDEDIVIGIAPGGGVSFGKGKLAFKRWPQDKFAELAGIIIKETESKVIFLWGPGEEGLIKGIVNLMDRKPIVAPQTTIGEMAALMSKCDCVVCNDSGPLHVAVAIGTKTVSIFGPSDQNVYGPYPKDKRHITVTKDIECRPCYKRFKIPDCEKIDCLRGLEAKEVFLAVADHIKRKRYDEK
ncbi:unnamed protein product, partial [marine sediment metagenome]